jgi:hypothetical protein
VAKKPRTERVDRVWVVGDLGPHEAEAFQLEIRRLARRYGRKIKELQIERAPAKRPARSP